MPVPRHDLKPYGRYLIALQDCCAVGELVGRFLAYGDTGEPDDREYAPLIFDIGIFTTTDAMTFTELEPSPDRI